MKKLPSLLLGLEEKTKNLPTFLIILLFAVLILRLPSLLEPLWYGDEGIYLTLGQAVRQGETLYQDIHDNKPPLLYWLAALAGNVFWFRFILLVWFLAVTIVFYKLAERVFSQRRLTFFSTVIFIFFTSSPIIEGLTTNAEHFFLGLAVLGIYFFIGKKFFWSGLMFGLGFLFKSPPLFDWLATLIFSFLLVFPDVKKLVAEIKEKLPSVIGFLLPTALIAGFYSLQPGALPFYFESVWQQNFPYLSSWGGGGQGLLSGSLFWRGIMLLIFLILVFLKRKLLAKKPQFTLVLIWLAMAVFAVFLSSRPYPHYLLQAVSPLALMIGFLASLGFRQYLNRPYFLIGLIPVICLIAGFSSYGFSLYRVGSYYQNFVQFALGQKSRVDYFNWFNSRTRRNYQVAQFISDSLSPGEKIFIWGNEPNIYALSRHLPTGRYTAAYHILDFDRKDEVLLAIKEIPPKIIIYDLDFPHTFGNLLAFLSNDYQPIEQFGSLQVWYRFQLKE